MTDELAPPSRNGASADVLKEALRSLGTTYIGARRAGGELRTRLLALDHERAHLLAAIGDREYGSASDRELAEIDRVRRTIARSSAASSERLRALEAVIAAIAGNVVRASARRTAAHAPTPPPRPAFVEVRPEAAVRGGWSPPSDALVERRGADQHGRRLR
jgi:hypothetical protein